jgi:tyrosine-protein kinase Etk/Wzc
MSETVVHVSASSTRGADEKVSLLDLLIVLGRQKRIIIAFTATALVLSLAAAVLIKPKYASTAIILPPQQQSSSVAAMLGQLGGLAGAAGSIAGLKNPNDLYIGMLQSRTITDKLIARFDLKKRYDRDTVDDTREALQKRVSILNGKEGLIAITVEDKDPTFSAAVANGYVAELSQLTKTIAVTEAAQRRLFFEQRLKEAKEQVANAEIAMRKVQESTGMVQLDGQVKAIISAAAQLQSTIAAKEVQIDSMRTFAAAQNPDLQRLQEELRSMRSQLARLQKPDVRGGGDPMVPTGSIPEVGVEYIRAVRDLKYNETIFELLAKQYELAKIDEARESSVIQQLDIAVPAEERSRPNRLVLIVGSVIFGVLLGIFVAILRNAYTSSRLGANRDRWLELGRAWKK